MQAELTLSKNGNLAVTQGCDWAVNSAEYNYSFWNLAKDLHGSPIPDKEIMQLLNITSQQLKDTYASAIKKLSAKKDQPEMQELFEIIKEMSANRGSDGTDYMPDSFKDKIYDTAPPTHAPDSEEEAPQEKPKKKLHGMGMPVHRSGKRTDLYGLSSKKKRKE